MRLRGSPAAAVSALIFGHQRKGLRQQGPLVYGSGRVRERPFMQAARNKAAEYFHLMLTEHAESTPIQIRELVRACENPDRTPADRAMVRAVLDDIALTHHQTERARRKMNRLGVDAPQWRCR
jgi:hypothetical protein